MVFGGMKLNWLSGIFVFLGGSLMAANTSLVYIGTYTGGKSKGIYVSKFDSANGTLSTPELAAEAKNPSFLCLHPSREYLYSVGEIDSFDGKKSGAVSAYRIGPSGWSVPRFCRVHVWPSVEVKIGVS